MTEPAPAPEKGHAQGEAIDTPKADPKADKAEAKSPTPPEKEEQDRARIEDALRKVESQNERIRKSVELNAELVGEKPELIHKIFKSDPAIADQVAEKLWGGEGVKSYKQLIERAKLEKTKAEDPKLYETAKSLSEVKGKLEERDRKDREQAEARFLKAKGIAKNEFDPSYRKLQESMKVLDPSFRESDPEKAMETAYAIAFRSAPRQVENGIESFSIGGGTPPPPLPENRPPVGDGSRWLADGLNSKFGYKIKL